MIELDLRDLAILAITWAAHLAALLGLAAIARRCLARERVAAREAWVKLALVGAPLTAFAQTQWVEVPWGGTFVWAPAAAEVARVDPSAASSAAPSSRPAAAEPGARAAEEPELPAHGAADPLLPLESLRPTDAGAAPREVAIAADASALERSSRSWWIAVASLWILGIAAFALRHLLRRARLQRQLARRVPLERGMPRELLDALCAETARAPRVRLSRADVLRVPVAFGWLRPEICVPSSLLGELGEAEWKPLLAHELAHLVRRDPLWLALCRAQAALCLGLPPLRWAERALRADAEWLADAWAAARTSPLGLARCLARVADRALHEHEMRGALSLAGHEEPTLTRRVERLLEPRGLVRASRGVRIARALGLAFCAALVLGAPALRSAPRPGAERASAEFAALQAPTRSSPALRELDALERELSELRERVSGTSLEAACAPLFERWEARVLELRAELDLELAPRSLPQAVPSTLLHR